jgi:hypothetical protein
MRFRDKRFEAALAAGLLAAAMSLGSLTAYGQQAETQPAAAEIQPAAAETQPAAPAAAEEATAEAPTAEPADIDELIRQLDANRFSQRQTATHELARLGVKAIAALEKAAVGESREVTTRSIDILKRHFKDGTADAKAAAKESLERIKKGEHPVASRLADQALNPEPEAAPPMAVPRIGVVPGQIQIRMQAIGGANGQRIQMKNVNGIKEVEVQEQDRKVKIVDDPQNGIKMEITEKKDGKETTKKYAAKNADDLKKQDPEAHKIYEKYSRQQGGIQIQGIQIGGVPLRVAPRAIPVAPQRRILPNQDQIADQLDKVQKQLEAATERIKAISDKADSADGESLRKGLEELQEAGKQLQETRQKLRP